MPCINIRQKPHIKAHLYKISELRDKVKMLKVSREKLWNGIFLLNSNTESWKTAKWCLLNLFHKGIIFILITEPKYQSPVRGHFQSPNVSKKKKKKYLPYPLRKKPKECVTKQQIIPWKRKMPSPTMMGEREKRQVPGFLLPREPSV